MALNLEEVRKMIIISLFADDDLYEKFVLKGGNALIALNINARGSTDIDISMRDDFKDAELDTIRQTLEHHLNETFKRKGYITLDVKLEKRPKQISKDKEKFWGGYRLEFKLVSIEDKEKYEKGEIDINKLRQLSILADGISQKKFTVDISKYEYCDPKMEFELDGFPIYIYTPIMIVYEKLRAICQQQEEYKKYVNVKTTPRPRDFFDIYTILEAKHIFPTIKKEIYKKEYLNDLKEIFHIKMVPLHLLKNIKNYREYHRSEFASVKDTVDPKIKLESFDFYFDYVLELCDNLVKALSNLNMMDNIISND